MAPLRKEEQRLFISILKTKALPMVHKGISWKSVDVWKKVVRGYNTRAQEKRFPTHSWTSLIQYGKGLQYCHYKRGRIHCNCLIPEFSDIDGSGESSSYISLRSTSAANGSGTANDATAMYRKLITSELVRLRRSRHFRTLKGFQNAMYAWQEELRKGLMLAEGFTQVNDKEKLALTKDLVQKHQIA